MPKLQNPNFTGWQLRKHKKQYRAYREANRRYPGLAVNIHYHSHGCKTADECIKKCAAFLSVQTKTKIISHYNKDIQQAIQDWCDHTVYTDTINLAAQLLGLRGKYPMLNISPELVLPHYSRLDEFGRENPNPPTARFIFRENWKGEIVDINLPPDRKATPEDVLRIPVTRMATLKDLKHIPASGLVELQSLSDRYLIKRKVNREDK